MKRSVARSSDGPETGFGALPYIIEPVFEALFLNFHGRRVRPTYQPAFHLPKPQSKQSTANTYEPLFIMCCSKFHLPLWIHILLAMWAVAFSVLEFLVFLFYFGNVFLAVTALSSVVPAALCFQLYSMEKAGNVESSLNRNALGCLFYFGLLGFIFAIAGAITYFTLGLSWQIPVFEMHRTLILCAVEACLGARWYYELAHISRGYEQVSRAGRRTKEITI